MSIIYDLCQQMRPHLHEIGQAGLIGLTATTALATARSLKGSNTFADQMKDSFNWATGAGLATLAYLYDVQLPPEIITTDKVSTAIDYVGAATAGAGIGALLRGVSGPADCSLSDKVREGAIRGAIAFPVGYALFNYISQRI
ncbi:MAG: hypothetical protein Q8Q01_01465 [archaeon]|nr:hypothetical protein [archaeon]